MATKMMSALTQHQHHRLQQPNSPEDDVKKPFITLTPDSFLHFCSVTERQGLLLKKILVEDAEVVEEAIAVVEGGRCVEPTVYSGLMGAAFVCLRSYFVTGNESDLLTAADISDACVAVTRRFQRGVTFLCGSAGVYALGAVIATYRNDHQIRDFHLDLFLKVAQEKALPVGPEEGGFGMTYELLYGRAGFLWSALFINQHLGPNKVPETLLAAVVQAILAGGRAGAPDNAKCPLMYRWHGTRYWGAAHGLAGIMQVLLHFPLAGKDLDDVKQTLKYRVSNRFACTGNYPSSEGNPRDKLVQWAHGAGGMAVTLCEAAKVFPNDKEFYDAAIEAGEVVWKKGLVRKVGLLDGISGNAYVFLSLYRLTGMEVYLERVRSFGCFLYSNAGELLSVDHRNEGNDHVYSLFEGLAGTACLWFDIVNPESSRFPGFEI